MSNEGSNDGSQAPPPAADSATGQEPGGSNLEDTGFTWGDNAPPEWQGKGADFAVEQYEKLARGIQDHFAQSQALQQPQQAYQAPAQPVNVDNDLLVTNPEQWVAQRDSQLGQQFGQYVQSTVGPIVQGAAENAKALSKMDPDFKDVWDNYGHEIEQMVSQLNVQPHLRANKQLWDQTARLVKGNHLDAFVDKRAQVLASEMASTGQTQLSSGSRGGAAESSNPAWEKLEGSEHGQRLIERYGKSGVMRNVEEMGYTLDQYADMAADTNVIYDPAKPGNMINRDITRGR